MSGKNQEMPAHTQMAVNSDIRSVADKKRDTGRKPGELLAFLGLSPGQVCAELMAGGCFMTPILSETVGPSGTVHSINSQALIDRFKSSPVRKLIEKHDLSNVVEVIAEPDAPGLPDAEMDAVYSIMIYHDMVWSGVDRQAMNRSVFNALKPSGIYGVVDHHAPEGSGIDFVQTTHRIEKSVVIEEVTAAGFELEAESDILENAGDSLDQMVHEKTIRDRTHRFVLRFIKPITD
jgi:predicted methyltransferase